MLLYLDFDGVLHPSDVVMRDNRPHLMVPGKLFMWAPVLEAVLMACQEIEIVLSTSWVQKLGPEAAQTALPPFVRRRVIGTTWCAEEGELYSQSTRYNQITRHVEKLGLNDIDWLAIDDDAFGWPVARQKQLVRCHSDFGLSAPQTQKDLHERLGLK